MRPRWIVMGLLIAAIALAASWGIGLWTSNPPVATDDVGNTAPTPPVKSGPTRRLPWRLENFRPGPEQGPDDAVQETTADSSDVKREPCGGAPCPVGSICVDGGCLSAACGPDAGESHCTLPNAQQGACCRGRCSDLENDPANCGRCGSGCLKGLECVAGRCQARSCRGQMAGTVCSMQGLEGACCRGSCADPSSWMSDPANCGGCGHSCAPGLACRQKLCVDPASGVRPAWTCLDEGHTCPDGTFCLIDSCLPRACTGESDGLLCPGAGGQVGHCCGQTCTNLFEDSMNCRACGVRCPEHQECRDGECVPAPQPSGAR